MNLFKKLEDSLQSPIKPIPNKPLPEDQLEKVKKIGEDIISGTMQRTLQEGSPKLGNSNGDNSKKLTIPNFFQ